jgi:hypothetical protein
MKIARSRQDADIAGVAGAIAGVAGRGIDQIFIGARQRRLGRRCR